MMLLHSSQEVDSFLIKARSSTAGMDAGNHAAEKNNQQFSSSHPVTNLNSCCFCLGEEITALTFPHDALCFHSVRHNDDDSTGFSQSLVGKYQHLVNSVIRWYSESSNMLLIIL